MSLDISLISETPVLKKGTGIFVRRNGENRELETIEEVRLVFPDADLSDIKVNEYETNEIFEANLTHNLGKMAKECNLYNVLWRPYMLFTEADFGDNYSAEMEFEDSLEIKAEQLIEPLRQGLHELKNNPEKYKKFNPENGWGTYEQLVRVVQNYLNACYEHKDAKVSISR